MTTNQDVFANMPVVAPPTNNFRQKLDQGLDFINEWIYAAGDKIGGAINALKETEAVKFIGSGGGLASAGGLPPLNASKSPESPKVESQQVAKSMVPERVQEQVKNMGSSNGTKMAYEHVSDGTYVSPMSTPNMHAGLGQGRGGIA